MLEYAIRRSILVIPVVFGVSLLVFFLIHFIPGDPAMLILGESAQPSDIEILRHELGLDQPVGRQLKDYYSGLFQFDLGYSLHRRETVASIIAAKFPATVELTLVSLFVALLIAMPLGIISAMRAGKMVDSASMFFALLGVSMPNFWLGPLLLLVFYAQLNIFPPPGRSGPLSYVLPAITLGTALAAILTRMVRSSLLDVIHSQYIRTAYAKGLSKVQTVVKHALRNAMIPVITILGLQFGALLGGSIITETIFNWPGIGRELIEAIQGRDYPVVQGCVLLISFSYVSVNLLTDLFYGFLDPRISYDHPDAPIWQRIIKTFKIRHAGGLRPIKRNGILIIFVIICMYSLDVLFKIHLTRKLFLLIDRAFHLLYGLWMHVKTGFGLNILLSILIFGVPTLIYLWAKKDVKRWNIFKSKSTAMIGFIIIMVFLIGALIGPSLTPHDYTHQNLQQRLLGPSFDHPFGTDDVGRDLLSRIIQGSRISLYVGFTVTIVSSVIGVLFGMVAGLYGGWIDDALMRIVDILLAFPGILLAIALVAVLGPDINNVILALCIMGWVGYARLARGQVLSVKEEDFVTAAKAMGASQGRLIFKHLLPNIMGPLIVQATLGMAGVIVAEAGLSFLGLGVQPPTPSWGTILDTGREFFHNGSHITIFPGLAIMTIVMGLNFFGDGLRDAFDPNYEKQV